MSLIEVGPHRPASLTFSRVITSSLAQLEDDAGSIRDGISPSESETIDSLIKAVTHSEKSGSPWLACSGSVRRPGGLACSSDESKVNEFSVIGSS